MFYAELMTNEYLRPAGKGTHRCWWPGDDAQYVAYHDKEWGRPVLDDTALYEKLCLEGFQSGLAWITVLRKRENFREAFAQFDLDTVAQFTERDIQRLLQNSGIIRHRGKIEATINNAARALELLEETGSLSRYIWKYAPDIPYGRDGISDHPMGFVSTSPSSVALSKDLKKRGWKFVGPTTVYSFMQSMGLVNDHVEGCLVRDACEKARVAARKKMN